MRELSGRIEKLSHLASLPSARLAGLAGNDNVDKLNLG